MVLDLPTGTADFRALNLCGAKLSKTSEGGWGTRITDFATGGLQDPAATDQEMVVSSEVVVYEAVKQIRCEPVAGLPLRELPRKSTSTSKGETIRKEQAEVLED